MNRQQAWIKLARSVPGTKITSQKVTSSHRDVRKKSPLNQNKKLLVCNQSTSN